MHKLNIHHNSYNNHGHLWRTWASNNLFAKSFLLWFIPQNGLHRTLHELHTKDVRFHLSQWFVAKHHFFFGNKVDYLLSSNFDSCVQFMFGPPLRLQLKTSCHPSIEWFFYIFQVFLLRWWSLLLHLKSHHPLKHHPLLCMPL